MKIYLNIEAESPEEVRSVLANLLGSTSLTTAPAKVEYGTEDQRVDEGTSTSAQSGLSVETADAPNRERGKPSVGKSRRTAEEVAEDKAADEADAARAAAGAETGAEVADRQISTSPEDRHDPNNPDDVADAADEAAETAASSGGKKTLDDVRGALGKYVESFGMDAAQAEGPQIITMMFGAGKVKVSDIPDTDKAINAALDTFAKVTEIRKANPDVLTAEPQDKGFARILDLFKKQAGF